jgi:pimeloyl-ACP methyl ester carboxylesterase
MCHGFTGNRVEAHRLFVRAAREFCRRGILTARFDFYGSGESEGEFHEMTLSSEIEDLGAILDYLLRRPEVDPRKVGALGLSMGGVVALARAAADGRIRFVVTWSAPASFQMLVETAENLFREAVVRGEYVDLPSGYRISREFIQDIARHTVLEYAPRISPEAATHTSRRQRHGGPAKPCRRTLQISEGPPRDGDHKGGRPHIHRLGRRVGRDNSHGGLVEESHRCPKRGLERMRSTTPSG